MSKFYDTDTGDPLGPRELHEWEGLRPGMEVVYTGPMPLPGPLVVAELVDFGDYVFAVLNDGEYEVNAANLAAAP